MKKKLALLWVLLAFCCSASAAQEAPELLEPAGVQLNAARAEIREISRITPYEASVVPYMEEFFFEQEGVIDVMHVLVGQTVKAGDPLITLNTEAEEERAKALEKEIVYLKTNSSYEDRLWQIDLEMLDVELHQLLNAAPRDDGAVALKRLEIEEKKLRIELEQDVRRLELEALESELESLQKGISRNVMTAPFDGTVMYMSGILQRGSYVSAYSPLIYLADDSRLYVESEYISASSLQSAHQVYAMIGDERYAVTPMPYDEREYLSQLLSGETLMLQFSLDEADAAVRAGDYAMVCVESEYVADALVVPTNALYSDDTRYLYVMENGVRVRRDVKTGIRTDWFAQITEGLEEGELVYVQE